MAYQHLFFDLDHTLWDFELNARYTLEQLHHELDLASQGIDDFDRFHRQYLEHNERLWDRYRKGFIKQDELRIKRMRLSLLDFKIANEALAQTLSTRFLELLPTHNQLFPGTHETLTYLKNKNYTLHIITNGFEGVQKNKMEGATLNPYFTHVITSEKASALKPHRAIFEHALSCSQANAAESIMIGDSVEVDIKGAWDMGIDQVHMNHLDQNRYPIQGDVYPTHTIFHLEELRQIL